MSRFLCWHLLPRSDLWLIFFCIFQIFQNEELFCRAKITILHPYIQTCIHSHFIIQTNSEFRYLDFTCFFAQFHVESITTVKTTKYFSLSLSLGLLLHGGIKYFEPQKIATKGFSIDLSSLGYLYLLMHIISPKNGSSGKCFFSRWQPNH